MTLGHYAHISLSVVEIQSSLKFYQQLGFTKVWEHPVPHPWMLLTDGVINIHLYESAIPSPTLNFFASDMAERAAFVLSLGIEVHHQRNNDGSLQQDCFFDPNDVCVMLTHHNHEEMPRPDGKPTSVCGRFIELSIPTTELDASITFWRNVGFRIIEGSSWPYRWVMMSDGVLTLGLHDTKDFGEPALLFSSLDMAVRIGRLKENGISLEKELKDRSGIALRGILRSPDGQAIFLLTA